MIILHTTREHVQTVKKYFFPYVNMYKETRLNNISNKSIGSEEYLSALTINCIISEIEALFEKKLINTTGIKIKFKLSEAQAIVLYRTLLALPLPGNQVYFHVVRNDWIETLHRQLINAECVNAL